MGRNSRAWLLALIAVAVWLGPGIGAGIAYAQPPEPWTEPVQLSSGLLDEAGQPLSNSFPTLVADSMGNVYAFWTRLQRDQDLTYQGLLFSSRWDGTAWSAPTDVLVDRMVFWRPQAAMDAAERIHLVWTVGYGGPIRYSSVSAAEARSARAWSEPRQISDQNASGVGIEVDQAGRIHVVFCSGDQDDRCYYTSSEDGVEWLSPSLILAGCPDCDAHVAVDERGRLHGVFGSQGTKGTIMYYARSTDDGSSWQPAFELDRAGAGFSEDYGPSWGTVIALGLDHVHAIWFGAPAGQRWHRWSSDGGSSWSQPEPVSSDHRGLTLPVAAAFDSAGTLHLVSMGWRESPVLISGAFHIAWHNGGWSEPKLIGPRSDWDAEYAAAVIVGGNLLVAAWTDKEGPKGTYQIWGSTLTLDAPRLSGATKPVALPDVTPQVEQVDVQPTGASTGVEGSPTPTSPSTVPGVGEPGTGSTQPGWLTYVAGVLPPVVLLALILAVRAGRLRRGG